MLNFGRVHTTNNQGSTGSLPPFPSHIEAVFLPKNPTLRPPGLPFLGATLAEVETVTAVVPPIFVGEMPSYEVGPRNSHK